MTIVHDVIDEHGNTVIAEETVKATFVYDAFNTSDRTTVDVPWSPEKNVAEYIGDLPTDVSYGYATDRRGVIEEKELTETRLVPGEHLIVTVVPQGGKIMMLVGMVIAVVVASVFTFGAAGGFGGPALAGMFAGGGAGMWVGVAVAWIAAISTITQGVMSMTQKRRPADSSPSYGIDGPKATNDETTPVPYVYGTMRVAGNKVNVFTENVTSKRQKIYVQYVVSEGPVKAITDIEINQQSADKYNNITSSKKDNNDSDDDGLVVKTDYRLGNDTQDVMPWFASSLSQYNVQARLTEDFATYTTQEEVNRIRLDLAFPNGLYHVTHKKGKYVNSTTPIIAEYALEGTDNWVSFAHDYEWSSIDYENNFTDIKVKGLRITVMVTGKDGSQNTPYNMLVQYRKATAANNTDTSTNWSTLGSESGNVTNTMIYENGTSVFKAGSYLKTFEVTGLDEDTYSFQSNGCTIVGVEAYYKQDLSWSLRTTTEYRMSVMSPPLPLGTYQVRVKRGNAESTETDTCNTLYLMDITQYQDNPVAYNNTAYYGAQIKLGTEISSEPTITALVQGRLVNIYDREGNVTAFQWSDNPADITLDILLNTNNNYGISASRIDFAAFDDWRKFCAANNLAFNGTFDTLTNVWDAVAEVTRVGRAGIGLEGLSWTVVIERAADPVMMFGQAQIVKGSLTIQWTGRKDRANLYEIQYYDKNDKYKQHSVFAMDDTFVDNGDALVQKTVTLTGVTDAKQAQNEAWLLLNIARYVNQVCSFEVPYQAVGVAVGDVFLLQHDIVDWGNEARVTSVNGNTITLDQPVADTTQSWNLFLIQSLTNVAAGVITDISGRDIVIQTLIAPIWTDADKTKPYYNSDQVTMNADTDYMTVATSSDSQRIVINGVEYGVEDKTIVGTEIHFTLDVAPGSVTGQKAQIFNIDALCQAPLKFVSTNSDNTQVWTVGAWENERNAAISVGARVLLGTSSVKAKPFRCTKITYKDDHTRTIAGAEYNESIYTANPQPAPNYSGLTEQPSQCSNVTYTLGNTVSQNGSLTYYADISWTRPLNDQRIYKSAKIYVNRNYGGFVLEQEIQNPTQTCRLSVNLADVIQVRVLATYENNAQASYADAPTVTFEVVSETMVPDNIDNTTLKAVGGIRLISLTWKALDEPYIASYEIYEAPSDDISKGYRVYIGDANYFNRTGLDPNTTAYYWIRTVSTARTVSEWSKSVSATTSYILTSDLEAEIANTATIAKQLLHDIGTPVAVEAATLPDAANYANGAYISYSTDGTNAKLFKNVNGTWTSVTGSVLVNSDGTISQATLPILSSDKVEQQLAENQITMLNKAAEDSSLTADQKAAIQKAVAAGKATQSVLNVAQQAIGNVAVSKVDNLSFSDINGQITSDQIAALQASKIAGQLTSDQISAIDAVKINGQITASQIASITAAQISTQLSSDQIEGLEAAKLIGQITADQLTQAPSNNLIWDGCGQSSDGWTKYWDYLLTDGSISATDSSSAQYVPGLGSALISGHWNKAANGSVEYAWEEIDAIAGQYYELQGEFCCQYSANAYLILRFLDANGNTLSQYGTNSAKRASNPASGLAGYTFVWTKNVAPANTTKILVLVHIDADNSDTSDVWFQVNFTKILLGVSTKAATVPMTWVNGSKPLVSAIDIHGTISSVQISSVDVSKVTNLTFDKVGGALTNSQQAAIDVANTIGNIPASRIPSVNSTAISGQLSDAQISDINASKVTGKLVASQIDTITAAQLSTQITSDQIAGLDAAKLTTQIVGTQISDGAISTPKIAAGAVVSASLASGSVTTEKLTVGSTNNLVENSCFDQSGPGTDGWSPYSWGKVTNGAGIFTSTTNNLYGWLCAQGNGTISAGSGIAANYQLIRIPENTRFYYGAFLHTSRDVLTGGIELRFFDNDGKQIGGLFSASMVNPDQLLYDFAVSPKGTCFAQIRITCANWTKSDCVTDSSGTPGIWIQRVQLGIVGNNVTEPLTFSTGGSTAINGSMLTTGTVKASAIIANSIGAKQIDADSIRTAVLVSNSVTADTIAAGSITTPKLAVGAVTALQIAANAITSDQIDANSIRTAILTANSVTAAQIAAGSIDASKINADSVRAAVLTANSISASMLQANSVNANNVDANSVSSVILTANSISTNMLQSGVVTAGKIAANTITSDQIDANSIRTAILIANSISTNMLQSEAVTADKIKANTITASQIDASSISAVILTANSISSSMIQSSAITTDKISAGAVVAASIAAGAVTTEKLTVGSTNNLVENSCFDQYGPGTDGWSPYSWGKVTNGAGLFTSTTNNLYGWLCAQGNGTISAGSGVAVNYDLIRVPENTRFYYGAFLHTSRDVLTGGIELRFFDNDGKQIGDTFTSSKVNPYELMYGFAVSPAKTCFAQIRITCANWTKSDCVTDSSGTPGIWIQQVQLGIVGNNVTEPLTFSTGGATSINGSMLTTGSVKASAIAANTITAAQINASSIQTAVLTTGSVVSDTIASNAITTAKISAGAVTTQQIASQTIIGDNIAGNTITAAKLVVSDVSAAVLTANSITTNMLQSGIITGDKINANSVSAAILKANSISASMIQSGSIDASKINAASIRAAILTAGSVTAYTIAGSSITGDKIAGNTITGNNIAGSAITADKLAVGSPNNMIQNSCFDPNGMGATNWVAWTDANTASQPAALLPNESSWENSPSSTSCGWLCISAYGTLNNAARLVCNPLNTLTSDNKLPANAGTTYCFSIYVGPSSFSPRCTMGFYDANGTQIGFLFGATITAPSTAKDISTYARPFVIGTAPARTCFVAVWLECWNHTGTTMTNGPGVAITQAQLAIVPSGTTSPPAWCSGYQTTIDGSGIKANTITGSKIQADSIQAAQIQGGAIGTYQLAARAITADKLAVKELIVSSAQIGNLVVGTSNMQDNSITTLAYGTATNQVGPFCDWTNCFSMQFNSSHACSGFIQVYFEQALIIGRSGSYGFRIWANGNIIYSRSGMTIRTDFLSICLAINLNAGANTIWVDWFAKNFTTQRRDVIVMGRMK